MKLAELFVEIIGRDGGLNKSLAAARAGLMGVVGVAGKAGRGIGGSLGGALSGLGPLLVGGAVGTGIYKAVTGAMDLNETLSKVGEVFGGNAAVVTKAADEMAKAFGIPKREFLDAASQFGLIAEGMGQSKEQAAGFSVQMAKLAADASSFYNIPIDQALEKIRAGLTGESEPLKSLGVIMSEEAVKAQALAMGFKEVGGQLSNEAKLAARTLIIQRGLAAAHGDLERTQGGAANQTRKFWGTLQNLGETLGTMVLPAFTEFITLANDALSSVAAGADKAQGAFGTFASFVHDALDTVAFTFRNFSDIGALVGLNVGEAFINLGERISYLGEVAGAFVDWFASNFTSIITDALTATLVGFENWKENTVNLVQAVIDYVRSGFTQPFTFTMKPLLEGFEAKTDAFKLPEQKDLTSFEADKQAVLDRIAENEAKRLDSKAKGGAQVAAAKPDFGKAPEQQAKAKEQKAEFTDLAGFAKKLQEGALGKAKDKAVEDTAKNTASIAADMAKVRASFENKKLDPGYAV